MKKSIQDAINEQINVEFSSAYIYLAMAAYCESKNLEGCAHWFKAQYEEEYAHMMKFYNFLMERGGKVVFKSISKPKENFGNILDVFEETLAHEKAVSESINKLYELAVKEKDYAFQSFLKWFIDEQVEEESTVMTIIDKIKMIGVETGPHMYMFDKELAERVKAVPEVA